MKNTNKNKFFSKKLITLITGNPENFPIEHRFLNVFCFSASAISFLATIINIVLSLSYILIILTGVSTLFTGFFYLLSLFKKKYTLVLRLCSLYIVIILPVIWITNAGISGGVIFVYIMALLLVAIITKGRERIYSLAVIYLSFSTIMLIEYFYPEIIIHYSGRGERFIDVFYTVSVIMILLIVAIIIIMKNYNDERIKAENSNRLKSAFLANISHELRTPLNGIIGFADLLKDNTISVEEKDEFIKIINNSGKHLLDLINDIIEISKIESGESNIDLTECSLNKLLNDIFIFFKNNNTNKNIEIKLNLEDPLNQMENKILIDKIRINQVLTNLIQNSFKFTEKGTIEFGYTIEDSSIVKFYVKDEGIGIEKDKQELIFDRFIQEDNSITRNYGGTGLGLSISKKLVNLMGGTITVESDKWKGAKFYFTIPFTTVDKKAVKISSEKNKENKSNNYNWSNKTLLIVEDDISSFKFLNRVIEKTGAKIIHFDNGQDAIKHIENHNKIDLILMDIQLPGISGYEAASKIKKINSKIPIIAQTANVMNDDKKLCFSAGCNDYIGKPIDWQLLLSKIDNFF